MNDGKARTEKTNKARRRRSPRRDKSTTKEEDQGGDFGFSFFFLGAADNASRVSYPDVAP
jgi:hypothetical protein